jgi:hypothetical protein
MTDLCLNMVVSAKSMVLFLVAVLISISMFGQDSFTGWLYPQCLGLGEMMGRSRAQRIGE